MTDEEMCRRMLGFRQTPTCTGALHRFFAEHELTVGFFFHVVWLVTRLDTVQDIAKSALNREHQRLSDFRDGRAFKSINVYADQNVRTLITSTANNLLCFISEILQDVLRRKPEVLKSKEHPTTADALQFSDFGDLIAFIADRKINELTYGGLRAMEAFISTESTCSQMRRQDCWSPYW